MINLKGKKLLILSGAHIMIDVVRCAKELGIFTIVTDWYNTKQSPAKLIADEYWDVSIKDYDELSKRIIDENINGILTGFTDSYLLPYQHLCELNHLPCYATKEQFIWTLDKSQFKEKCRKYDVPTVPDWNINDFNPNLINDSNKVIIKPVDNSGSRGIHLCSDPGDFYKMLNETLSFSEKREVVIERYMDCDDISFEYTIQDGDVMLSAICDRYIYKTNGAGSITSKLVYPSKYLSRYLKCVNDNVVKMFKYEGFKNGVLFMQAFVEGNNFYFYEMGYRLSGGRHYIFTDVQNNRSALKELIFFAVNGKMSNKKLSNSINPNFKQKCCQVSVLCKEDEIAIIEGLDRVKEKPEVIDCSSYYGKGDTIGKEGTTAQIFARIHIVADNMEDLNHVVKDIYKILKVKNSKGDNLILSVI